MRITAGAFGTSISTTLWDNRAAMHHAHLAESINGGSARGHAGARPACRARASTATQASRCSTGLINAQAYVLSADDIFYASAVIFLLLFRCSGSRAARGERRGGRRRRALTAAAVAMRLAAAETMLTPVRRRVDVVHPVHFLGLLDHRDVEVHDHRLLAAAAEHARQRLGRRSR